MYKKNKKKNDETDELIYRIEIYSPEDQIIIMPRKCHQWKNLLIPTLV